MRIHKNILKGLLFLRMGAHLSSPRTEKVSSSGGDLRLDSTIFGSTSMQGWRISMEDAHLTMPNILFYNNNDKLKFRNLNQNDPNLQDESQLSTTRDSLTPYESLEMDEFNTSTVTELLTETNKEMKMNLDTDQNDPNLDKTLNLETMNKTQLKLKEQFDKKLLNNTLSSTGTASGDLELDSKHLKEELSLISYLLDNNSEFKGSIYGVFDGHGGNCVSKWVSENFSEIFKTELNRLINTHMASPNELNMNLNNNTLESYLIGRALENCFLKLDEYLSTPQVDLQLQTMSNNKNGNNKDKEMMEHNNLFKVLLPDKMSNRQHALDLIQQLTSSYGNSSFGKDKLEEINGQQQEQDDQEDYDEQDEDDKEDNYKDEFNKTDDNNMLDSNKDSRVYDKERRSVGFQSAAEVAAKAGLHSENMNFELDDVTLREAELERERAYKTENTKDTDKTEIRETTLNKYDSIPYFNDDLTQDNLKIDNELGVYNNKSIYTGKEDVNVIVTTDEEILEHLPDKEQMSEDEKLMEKQREELLEREKRHILSIQQQQQLLLFDNDGMYNNKNNGLVELDSDKEMYAMGCGATSVVAVVLEDPYPCVIVANAGDSRCVLSRNKVAIPLSIDHKPTDEQELLRIRRAGGSVINGRVDGNLNLSRSLGDLSFKLDKTLNQKEQKITAFPDIQIIKLTKQDEFLVLACDGIWDCKSNQQVVDFIHYKYQYYLNNSMELNKDNNKEEDKECTLKDVNNNKDKKENKKEKEKYNKSIYTDKEDEYNKKDKDNMNLRDVDDKKILEKICEELCDICLSNNPSESEGIGCDNMTIIIVKFSNKLYKKIESN